MKVLVFGKTGQVARELARHAPTNIELSFIGREAADLREPATCVNAIIEARPDAVINAAAWTFVDKAEQEEQVARVVNGVAPAAMAEIAAQIGIPFLHVSTDYVFDGSGTLPWQPCDSAAPLNAYGRTKLEGEQRVLAAGGNALILRTSWVFSVHGTNFVKTMLRLSQTTNNLRVVGDQTGGPTAAADIAATLCKIACAMRSGARGGVHHFAGASDTTWADFARAILTVAGKTVSVEDIPTSAYPTPAKRPLNSRLDCTSLATAFAICRPRWETALQAVVKEICS